MAKIFKSIERSNKFRIKDRLVIPEHGEFEVISIYDISGKGFSIFCENITTKKHYAFSEEQIVKYKKSHLRLVK